jgi:hypothetical protein
MHLYWCLRCSPLQAPLQRNQTLYLCTEKVNVIPFELPEVRTVVLRLPVREDMSAGKD